MFAIDADFLHRVVRAYTGTGQFSACNKIGGMLPLVFGNGYNTSASTMSWKIKAKRNDD
jgi:hypothetical protein